MWRQSMKVGIEGLPELLKTLEELPKSTQKSTLQRVLKKAGQPILESIERGASAHRDSGRMVESFSISTRLNPANQKSATREGKNFAEVYVGTRRGSAAILVEWGTVNMTAKPFIRPAWDSNKERALGIIRSEIWSEVSKSAARNAKKLAKLGG
jgi:HK97 gp10 family phage protein